VNLATLTSPADAAVDVTGAGEPYKFLDFFEESDRESFAGRDRDIQDCLDRITTQRVFVLYARSGYGKTSLLKAGLFPRLRGQGLRPVYIRTLQNPVGDLHAALLAEAGPAPSSSLDRNGRETSAEQGLAPSSPVEGAERETSAGAGPSPSFSIDDNGSESSSAPCGSTDVQDLEKLVQRLPSTGRIVLVLDQFEEFFILFRDDRKIRGEFVETIRRLITESSLEIHVVFSLREDYLAELDEFQGAIPRLFDRCYRLLPLTPFGAREAITRPLRRHGIAYSPTLVTRMVEELDRVNLDPPLIQIFCTEVYRKAVRRGAAHTELTEEDVDRVGGLDEIFRRYLSDVTGDSVLLADPLLARCVLDALLTQENTKRAATLADLTKARFRASSHEIEPILRVFVRSYLVRRSLRNGVEWFELIHERLVPFVQEWLDQDADFVNFWIARDLITYTSRGEYWRKQTNLLLNPGQIEGVIKPFRGRLDLSAMEAEFVFQSALVSRSSEAGYWADQLGPRKSVAMLLEALRGIDRTRRLGAASIAGSMTDPTGVIQDACGGFSNESDPEIRRAAAQSYTRLKKRYGRRPASNSDLQVIVSEASPPGDTRPGLLYRSSKAVADRVDRNWPAAAPLARSLHQQASRLDRWLASSFPVFFLWVRQAPELIRRSLQSMSGSLPALDFLATRAEAGDDLAEVPFWLRIRARSIAADRLRKAEAASISPYARKGAVPGLLAGCVWSLTVGYLCLLFSQYLEKNSSTDLNFGISGSLGGLLIFALILGSIVGYCTCLADARVAIISGRAFRPFRLARSRIFVAFLAIPALISAFDVCDALLSSFSPSKSYSTSSLAGMVSLVYALLFFLLFITSSQISRSWRIALVVAAVVSIAYLSITLWSNPSFGLAELARLVVWISLSIVWLGFALALTEGMIHVSLRCFSVRGDIAASQAPRSWVPWVCGTAVSLPLSVLAVLCLAARAFGHPVGPMILLAVIALSFVVAVSVPARLYASRSVPLQIKGPDHYATSSTLARRFCLTTMILAPLALNSIWGLDTFPWFAKRYELEAGERTVIRLQAGPAFPDVSYASLIAREPRSILVSRATGPTGNVEIEQFVRGFAVENRVSPHSGQWYLVPPGLYRFRLKAGYDAAGPAIQTLALDLEERDIPSSEGIRRLGSDSQPIAITLLPMTTRASGVVKCRLRHPSITVDFVLS